MSARKGNFTKAELRKICSTLQRGASRADVARSMGVSPSAFCARLNRYPDALDAVKAAESTVYRDLRTAAAQRPRVDRTPGYMLGIRTSGSKGQVSMRRIRALLRRMNLTVDKPEP